MDKKNLIDHTIKKIQRKIWLNNILKSLINAILISSLVVLIFMAVIHLIMVIDAFDKLLILTGVILTVSLAIGLVLKPNTKKTVLIIDSMGLKERFSTYLEYKDEDSQIVEVFKEELEDTINEVDVIKQYKFNIMWKRLLSAFVMLVIATAIYFVPATSIEVAKEKEQINREIKKEAQKILEIKEDIESTIENDESNEKEAIQELSSKLQELENNLKKNYDYNEATLNVSDTRQDIQNVLDSLNSKIAQDIAGVLSGMEDKHQLLIDALESGNIESAIEIAKKDNFSVAEKKQIKENLKSISNKNNLAAPSTINDALNKVSTALEDDNLSGERLAEILQATKDDNQLAKVEEETNMKLESMQERLASKGDEGFASGGGNDRASDYEMGENERNGSGEMTSGNDITHSAMGDNYNQQSSSADGLGGGNANSDASNQSEKIGEINIKDDPSRLGGGTGETTNLSGEWHAEGSLSNKDSDNAIGLNGESVELTELLREFKKVGMDYVFKYDIPLENKELVLEYFEKLNGGN